MGINSVPLKYPGNGQECFSLLVVAELLINCWLDPSVLDFLFRIILQFINISKRKPKIIFERNRELLAKKKIKKKQDNRSYQPPKFI